MNLFGIEINAQNVALAFTIVFLIFVVLNGFLGFLRGSKKSIFYLIVTAVVFGLGFGLMLIAISALMKMPVGKWLAPLVSNVYPEITATSSMEDIVLGIITNQFPQFAQAVQEGSVTASFVLGIVAFAVKLVYIIVLLILAFTLFKLIADIIWLIIRPKKKDGVRPKKTFGGRMIGFGIGAFKGAVYSLLIFTLIAGVASIATSAMAVAETTTSNNNTEAVLVLSEGKASLITLDANEGGSNSSGSLFGDVDMDFLAGIVGAYRKSVPGAMFGAIKVSSVPFDEFLFDGVFSFDVQMGDEKVKVKLRSEIESVANAFAKVANEFDLQNPSLEAILSIGDEGEAALKGLVDAISDLKILKVAIPVALEIGMYSDFLKDENGENQLQQFFTPDQIPDLTNALLGDIKSIGYSLVDARKVIAVFVGDSEEEKDINTFLNLDSDAIKLLFDEDHLGGLDTIDILAPIGITYLTTIEAVKTSLDEFGLDLEQLTNMPEGATWSGEIAKLGDVYIALQDLLRDPETGRVFIDKDNYASIIDLFTEEKINNFVDTLFTSNLVNNASGALVTFAREKLLPEDYKQYITIGEGVKFDANECKAFLNAASCLVKSGFLSMFGEEGGNIGDMIDKLDVNDLARYLSQSTIVRDSLSNSLDLLLSNLSTEEMQLRFGTFEDWDDAASTEVELRSVLKAMKILGKNLFNSEGENAGFSINTLAGLTEAELEAILTSKIMRGTIVNFLVDNSGEGQTLSVIGSGVTRVNANPDNWYDQFRILEGATLNGNTLSITSTNKTLDQEYKINHYLVYCNGTYLTSVRCTAGEDASLDLTTVKVGKDGEGNAIYHTPSGANQYVAYGVNLQGMGSEAYTISGTTLSINPAHVDLDNENNVNKFNVYADGELIYSVRVNEVAPLNIDLSTIKVGEDEEHQPVYFELKEDTKIEVYGYNEGELRKIFIAILSITSKLGEDDLDFSNTDNLTSALSKVEDSDIENITASVVINDALITAIEDLSKQESPFIYVPAELKDGEGKVDHDKWDEADESANILKAIKVIFNGSGVNADNLKIKPIVDSKDTILKSLIICETLKQNVVKTLDIEIPNGAPISNDTLEGWTSTYNAAGEVVKAGELSIMLDVIETVLSIDDETTINGISTDNLKLAEIVNENNRDEKILRSIVISLTIKSKLTGDGIGIKVPTSLKGESLDGWINVYDEEDGTLKERHELSYLIEAVDIILQVGPTTTLDGFDVESIKLSRIVEEENRQTILKSLVIVETIKNKILDLASDENSGISVPDVLKTENEQYKWEDAFVDGVVKHGELWYLLGSIEVVLDGSLDDPITEIKTDKITLRNITDEDSRDTIILKSLIISETIKATILKLEADENSGIKVPQVLKEDNPIYKWENTELSRGELSHLLEAIGVVLAEDLDKSINEISAENITLSSIVSEQNRDGVILKSLVISETIKAKIIDLEAAENSGIKIPSSLKGEAPTEKWENTYEGNNITRGELSHLLEAIGVVLADNLNQKIDKISVDDIKLENVTNEAKSDVFLRSLILAETIKAKIIDLGADEDSGIKIPSSLNGETPTEKWENTYASEEVTSRGELSHLLSAVGVVLADSLQSGISNIKADSIKLSNIVSEQNRDNVILKSLVISETIKTKIIDLGADAESGIKIPSSLKGETPTEKWENTYEGSNITRGELSHLLEAIGVIFANDLNKSINGIKVESITLGSITSDDNRDSIILASLVISETIKSKIIDLGEKESSGISIPADLLVPGSTEWENRKVDGVLVRGELSYLLKAIGVALANSASDSINNIDANKITLKRIVSAENRDRYILRSRIISETIKDKICDPANGISTPSIDNDKWYNTYNVNEIIPTSRGEISHLLEAVSVILADELDKDISNVKANSIKLSAVVADENRDTVVLKSLVISETIKDKVCDPANGISTPTLDDDEWYNTYDGEELQTRGEISHLLKAVSVILADELDKDISNVKANSIKLASVVNDENRDTVVLKSLVISETIKDKVCDSANGISTPSIADDEWYNTYNGEELQTRGEISHLLKAVSVILTEEELNKNISGMTASSIKLSAVVADENRDTVVLKSLVISETIKDKVCDSANGISTPSIADDEWYNTYNGEELQTRGEISHLLKAVSVILADELDKDISQVNGNNLKVMNIVDDENRDTIVLKSQVIALTIKNKFIDLGADPLSGIKIPTELGDNDWYNSYTGEEVTTRGELSHLLAAISVTLNIDANTTLTTVKTDNIKVANLIVNCDTSILKSLILSETIKQKIVDLETNNTGIAIPNSLSKTNLTGWENTYASEEVTSRGELSKLIAAIGVMFNITPSSEETIDNLVVNNISLLHVIDNSDGILKSSVLTETIKTKVSVGTGVDVPNEMTSPWENTYDAQDEFAIAHGELHYLLQSIKVILNPTAEQKISEVSVAIKLGNIISGKATILHSEVLTETIKNKIIEASSTGALKLPIGYDDTDSQYFVDWDNKYRDIYNESTHEITPTIIKYGELDYLLKGVGELIENTDKSIDQLSFEINYAYNKLVTREGKREEILKSFIISETLRANFVNTDALSSTLSAMNSEVSGIDISTLSAWYVIDKPNTIDESERTIEKEELWNLIESIYLLIGDTFDASRSFKIDDLLDKPDFYPELTGEELVNTNSNIATLLQSKIVEKVFADLVVDVVLPAMSNYLLAPTHGYIWYSYVYETEHNSHEDCEYDLQSFLESISKMQDAGLNYSTFGIGAGAIFTAISSVDKKKLSQAFVISRSFRGSIAYAFNTITGYPIFNQAEYDKPLTKATAAANLEAKLNIVA